MPVRIEVFPRPDRPDPATESLGRTLKASLPGLEGIRTATIYLVEGLSPAAAARLAPSLFADLVVETVAVDPPAPAAPPVFVEIAKRPGVMDPVALSALDALKALGEEAAGLRIVRRVTFLGTIQPGEAESAALAHLANATIEQVAVNRRVEEVAEPVPPYALTVVHVPIRELDEAGLTALSKKERLALTPDEMKAIQAHFRAEGREPTDLELLTLAQTWSEHCVHKTFRGTIRLDDGRRIPNLLKSTVFEATRLVRDRLGKDDFCVSVFTDNAGVIRFDERFHLAVKVETHNHPSALEPYGGAGTGVGGVIRDILGCGLGAWPIANLDVFCFAPPDLAAAALPAGTLPPARVMAGVVAGVRDYGNRMGIPTVNGSVNFHPRYAANPLVYCGTLGILPVDKVDKSARAGDLIVMAGGRTGRDGIGGATFSSDALDASSAKVSSGAVQIGNAIAERRVLDAQMRARDLGLYRAVTDCGAGGLSSAVGEMGAELGAEVALEKVPLKYGGLSYAEIWLSEAQERMVYAVPPEHAGLLLQVFAEEGVDATVLGHFGGNGLLRLTYAGAEVGRLPMRFLHEGRPAWEGKAVLPKPPAPQPLPEPPPDLDRALLALLADPTVASKEAVVRQYDHEVQGQTVGKPFVGFDGPADAAVLTPVLGSPRAVVLGHGIGFRLGDLDAYQMAAQAVDEALRNVVAAGGDPGRTALLDNFCWGSCADPAELGKLVRASEACRDVALAFGAPFVSGKDSLNNTYQDGGVPRHIPPTLLVTAVSVIADAAKTVSMDLKRPGNPVYLVGPAVAGMGGSLAAERLGLDDGRVPAHDPALALRIFQGLWKAASAGLVASCHDLSDGGLLVAAAEMVLAGRRGLVLDLLGEVRPDVAAFGEAPSRFLVEVPEAHTGAFQVLMAGLPWLRLGEVQEAPRLVVHAGRGGRLVELGLDALERAWRGTFPVAPGRG